MPSCRRPLAEGVDLPPMTGDDEACLDGDEELDSGTEEEGCMAHGVSRLPDWAILPLVSCCVVLALLAVILPVYFKYQATVTVQDDARLYPVSYLSKEQMLQQNVMVVSLDLSRIHAETRVATFALDVDPGGKYEQGSTAGAIDLGGNSLAITIGSQSLSIASGKSVSGRAVEILMRDVVRLSDYPFDSYRINVSVTCDEVHDSNTSDVKVTSLPVAVVLYEGESGWSTESTLGPLLWKNGSEAGGISLAITVRRSGSIIFFSIFIVLLMWAISLGFFVLALRYSLSDDEEVAYDVPALAVGLLFALPFVRAVQPDVPTVGIAIDMLGFFFNMLLIAVITVVVLFALSSRQSRQNKKKEKEKQQRKAASAAARAAQHAEQGGGDSRTGAGAGSMKTTKAAQAETRTDAEGGDDVGTSMATIKAVRADPVRAPVAALAEPARAPLPPVRGNRVAPGAAVYDAPLASPSLLLKRTSDSGK
ncbi:hypothetical protein FOA52_006275 [Chlamydomonas sp. UWO 241]|nr:hypothetical protein FOA52_006275 [Chlamydomonas sp. UWO 241]